MSSQNYFQDLSKGNLNLLLSTVLNIALYELFLRQNWLSEKHLYSSFW